MALPSLQADIIDGIFTRKNYIRGQLDKNVSGWATYKDAAATFPADGTGGSPTVTWTLTTSSPLRDTASFLFTQPASNTQGEGVSYAFSIDRSDRYQVLRIDGEYEVKSGTFSYGDGTVTSPSDIRIFIYDITNSVLIEPTNTLLDGSGKFTTEFQASDSQSYRLILHKATTAATAFTVAFDSISVGPREVARGPIITDWAAFTMSVVGTTTNPTKASSVVHDEAWWRRIGDTMEIKWSYRHTNSAGANSGSGVYLMQVPFGLSADNSKITDTDTNQGIECMGSCSVYVGGTNYYGVAKWRDTGAGKKGIMFEMITEGTAAQTELDNVIGFAASADVRYTFQAFVPILGWGSNTQISSDAGTREHSSIVQKATAQSVANNTVTKITFPVVNKDLTGLWDSVNNRFVVKEIGRYLIGLVFTYDGISTTGTRYQYLYKNGTQFKVLNRLTAPTANTQHGAMMIEVDAVPGDYFEIFYFQNSGGSGNWGNTTANEEALFTISKVASPQTIGMADRIASRYSTNAGQSIPNNTLTIVNFEDVDYDDTNAVTVGASWNWEASRAGLAEVMARVTFLNSAFSAGTSFEIQIFKNGVSVSGEVKEVEASSASLYVTMAVSDKIKVVAGDLIDIRIFHNEGASRSLYTGAINSNCSIELR